MTNKCMSIRIGTHTVIWSKQEKNIDSENTMINNHFLENRTC